MEYKEYMRKYVIADKETLLRKEDYKHLAFDSKEKAEAYIANRNIDGCATPLTSGFCLKPI